MKIITKKNQTCQNKFCTSQKLTKNVTHTQTEPSYYIQMIIISVIIVIMKMKPVLPCSSDSLLYQWHPQMMIDKKKVCSNYHHKTLCKYECMILSLDVSKILTACRMLQILIAQRQMKAKIHSFPTMYILGGDRCGRNGSNHGFRPRIRPKNIYFSGTKS